MTKKVERNVKVSRFEDIYKSCAVERGLFKKQCQHLNFLINAIVGVNHTTAAVHGTCRFLI